MVKRTRGYWTMKCTAALVKVKQQHGKDKNESSVRSIVRPLISDHPYCVPRKISSLRLTTANACRNALEGIPPLSSSSLTRCNVPASVNPEILQAMRCGYTSASLDLLIASLCLSRVICHILKTDFFFAPCMRQDSVRRNISFELLGCKSIRTEKTHVTLAAARC